MLPSEVRSLTREASWFATGRRLLRTEGRSRAGEAQPQVNDGTRVTSEGRTLRENRVRKQTISRAPANDRTRATNEGRTLQMNGVPVQTNGRSLANEARTPAKRSDDGANEARTLALSALPLPFARHRPSRAPNRASSAARTPALPALPLPFATHRPSRARESRLICSAHACVVSVAASVCNAPPCACTRIAPHLPRVRLRCRRGRFRLQRAALRVHRIAPHLQPARPCANAQSIPRSADGMHLHPRRRSFPAKLLHFATPSRVAQACLARNSCPAFCSRCSRSRDQSIRVNVR